PLRARGLGVHPPGPQDLLPPAGGHRLLRGHGSHRLSHEGASLMEVIEYQTIAPVGPAIVIFQDDSIYWSLTCFGMPLFPAPDPNRPWHRPPTVYYPYL